MNRKMMCMLLTGAMAASLLTGCGSTAATETASVETQVEEETAAEEVAVEEAAVEETVEEAAETASGDLPLAGTTLIFTGDAFNPYRIIGSDGELSGYDFDVLAALQEKLGFEYEFVEAEFAAVLTSVASGTADFAMTLTPKEERKESFDFTQSYTEPKTGVGFMPGADYTSLEDLKGKKIIAPSATTFAETAYAVEDAEVIEMENIPLACEEVKAGRADALLCDSVQLSVYAEEYGFDTFVASQEEAGVIMLGSCIGFAKGSEYVSYFDDALTELKEDGTLTELQIKWLGEESATVY